MGGHEYHWGNETQSDPECSYEPDLMDLALDAIERGDYEAAIRLAHASNDRLRTMIEWKNRLAEEES